MTANPSSGWKVVAVSVPGFSHVEEGAPCQDAHAYACVGPWLIASISDGAGSASHSEIGSSLICSKVVQHISSIILRDQGIHPAEETSTQWIHEAIETVRSTLQLEPENNISDFHATLLVTIAGPAGGTFFHIGDGVGCVTDSRSYTASTISLPENGEYANETYFFTEPNWQDHLRVSAFDKDLDLVLLMSDGVSPFAMEPHYSAPKAAFFSPITSFLTENTPEAGAGALRRLLERDAIRQITGDDKTLLWALRVP